MTARFSLIPGKEALTERPYRAQSERILQCQLKLAHRNGRRADHAEALARGIGRCAWKRRTRKNVPIGSTPGRVIQRVERFQPELYDMVFALRHVELLMQGEIDRLEMRRGQRIPRDIAKGTRGSFDERGRIVPSRRRGVRDVSLAGQR